MIIDLIRHTTPKIDPGICYGQTDLQVTDRFKTEFEEIRKRLMEPYDKVITSPLLRCQVLANSIKSKQRQQDPRLKEYNFGDWEMQAWNSLNSEAAIKWMDNFVEEKPPNGENLIQMQDRVAEFWTELTDCNHLERIAVVTHAGVLRLIHASIFETPLSKIFRLKLNYGSVMRVCFTQNNEVLSLQHL